MRRDQLLFGAKAGIVGVAAALIYWYFPVAWLDPAPRVEIVHATRKPAEASVDAVNLIRYGASPRAALALAESSRGHALLRGRGYVVPEDVKAVGADVLRHRVILSYEAEAEEVTPDEIIARVFDAVEVP